MVEFLIDVPAYDFTPGSSGLIFDVKGDELYTNSVTGANQTVESLNMYRLQSGRVAASKSNVTTTLQVRFTLMVLPWQITI